MKKKNTKEKILDALEGKTSVSQELEEWIGGLKKGEKLFYWDIADRFYKVDRNQEIDYNIVEEYENTLDELEARGIIEYKKDEEGNDNIIIKK